MQSSTFEFSGVLPRIHESAFVAPGARIIGKVTLKENVNVWFNAVLRADEDLITVGEGTNIQDGCVLHQDPGFPVTVGKNVTVGHLALLHGCTIGDGALIGMGAVILTGAKIGAGAVIGAGALVPEGKEIPPGTLALGSPAKVVRELTAADRERFSKSAQHYMDTAAAYQRRE